MLLNKHNLNIAKVIPAQQNKRFGRAVIQVRPDCTVATDGYLLVKVTTPQISVDQFPILESMGLKAQDSFTPFTLDADKAITAANELKGKTPIPVLNCAAVAINGDPLKPKVVTTDLERYSAHSANKSAHYPDWERVIPKAENTTLKIGLDARKLKVLLDQFINFAEVKGDVCITLELQSATTAITMTRKNDDQTMTAVLMPMRIS